MVERKEEVAVLEDAGGFDLAIVGMAGRFPGARDVGEFWRNLCAGVESVSFFSAEQLRAAGVAEEDLADPDYVRANAVLDGVEMFDAEFFGFNAREAEITDPQHRLFLECAWEALEQAGYEPRTYPGVIGVYAGVERNTYIYQIQSRPEIIGAVGVYQTVLGNDKDYLCTRLSYKLDLTGPSLVIQSACSTSLVAVHVAAQGLLAGDCDMALVGGVSVLLPQIRGYWYSEGAIYSPDGHCRAFDARAQGTLGGNGLGLVVLKRLEDAVSDGDHIHAVIKGTAINNDGGRKIGYSAPSVEGQAHVIRAAQTVAGVEPGTITYVEAHGTGTPLGDPIEFEALNRVFQSAGLPRGTCALGSVKTNMGHLGAAAGVTGLIKTALALEHHLLPPSLHFEQSNPKIDLDSSPFFVNTELRPWERNDGPLRAGVSSFGIGGTNAHVVLEEPPPAAPSGPSRPWQLLLLSARTAAALEEATRRFTAYLAQDEAADLADIAFTAQVGRRRFAHRRMLLASDRRDALQALDPLDPQRVLSRVQDLGHRQVVFLFPGQGSQYPGMGRGLYDSEPTFRREIDRCAKLLAEQLEADLRELLFPPAEEEAALGETAHTQPALFAFEYSLARLWMSWGVKPVAMLGHSLGEYVAACLAGVFSLEDALALVTARGRLMQATAPGAMLAVPRSEQEVTPLLAGDLALAVVNGPAQCVVAGPAESVEALRQRLAADGVEARILRTARAFHSPLMEPALEPFTRELERVRLAPPEIPFLSNTTGTWIEPAQATDPAYWVGQLRRTVRFGEALEELLTEPQRLLLEVGPGRTLGSLARRHPRFTREVAVLQSVRHRDDRSADLAFLLTALGRLWLEGVEIDWPGFYAGEHRRRAVLPTYPFERQRYWVEMRRSTPATDSAGESVAPADTSTPDPGPEALASAHTRPDLANPYVAPRSEVEERLVTVWEELLGIQPVGIYDNFFDLGGHSLLAARVAARVRERTGVAVPLADLFENPTAAGMAAALSALAGSGEAPPALESLPKLVADRERRHEPFPLTDVQQAYWVGRGADLDLGNVSTFKYLEMEYDDLDLERFEGAWRRLLDRHDMLRAVVLSDGRQQVLEQVPPYEVEVLDLRRLPEVDRERALAALRHYMSHQVLPCDRWPLFRVRATLLPQGRIRLHIGFDLLIGDAWSWVILLSEMSRFYRQPELMLPPLEVSFRDYVLALEAFESSAEYRRSEEYWRARLESMPAAPELPLAKSPAAIRQPRFIRRQGQLPAERWEVLKARASQAGLTPSGLALAAFSEVLAAWSLHPRFTLNLTLFYRLELHPQVDQMIGDFTSLILLEVDRSWGETFEARAKAIQRQLWDDLDHRYYGGVQVQRELARRGRVRSGGVAMPYVVTSTLAMADIARGTRQEGESGETAQWRGYGISQTPQIFLDHQADERFGALMFNWDGVEELFPPGLLDAMFGAYCRLLERLAEGEEAWQQQRFRLLPPVQRAQRLEINATAAPVPAAGLHTLFERQAAAATDRVVAITPQESLTFGEVDRRSARLAERLSAAGAGRDRLVGVVLEKGWEQLVAVLGVLRAGAAYLPVEPSLPEERRRYLLEHGEVEVAVTVPHLAGELEWPQGVSPLALEASPAPAAAPAISAEVQPEDLAYVVFTSGSTGAPKGVMIEHRGAVNTLVDVNHRFSVGPGDRVLALSSLAFDLSVYDLLGLPAAGGCVVFPEPAAVREPARWVELIGRHRVTLWNTVPALMVMLLDFVDDRSGLLDDDLRLALLSGDWLPLDLPRRIRRRCPEAEVVSLGGATEASIWSILYPVVEVDPAWPSIPYGRPMVNQTFHVLDAELEPRPTWVPGELYIGGIGLARGYWRDEEKTRASFIEHPVTGERLYRTGDLGRYLPDGNIEFLGREDFQVKIQGHRIELGEIEWALCLAPEVRSAAVITTGESRHQQRLAACVVPEVGAEVGGPELESFLRQRLPAYMVPASWLFLDALPLTANGKVDRQALARLVETGEVRAAGEEAPRTPTEEVLAGIWSEVLSIEPPGREADFFVAGGDSLTATRVIGHVRDAFGVEVSLRTIFEFPTLTGLTRQIERALAGGAASMPPIETVPRERPLPLSFSQERLWFFEQLNPGTGIYNIPRAVRFGGSLQVAILEASLGRVERRHEILRTTFVDTGEGPVQRPSAGAPLRLPVIDLSGLAPEVARAEGSRLAGRDARRPFDLVHGLLWRATLLRLAGDDHLLSLTLHHIVCDAWSLGMLEGELVRHYRAAVAGQDAALPELPVQYADFAVWQRQQIEEVLERQLDYWRAQLAGAPAELELPFDRPRPQIPSYRGGSRRVALPTSLAASLRQLSRRHNATLFMTLLAAYKTLLHLYSGQQDLVVGIGIANRTRPEIEPLIGCFVNLLPLRTDLAGNPPFTELLGRVRTVALGAYSHQDLPFEKLVDDLRPDRRLSVTPLFQVMFEFHNVPEAKEGLGGVRFEPLASDSGAAPFDLSLFMREQGDHLYATFHFNRDLFDPDSIDRMAVFFLDLLAAIVERPDVPLQSLAAADREAASDAVDAFSAPLESLV